jgi:glutaredoxin-like protein NrdH
VNTHLPLSSLSSILPLYLFAIEDAMVNPNHVDGDKPVEIFIYALSTCGWCQKTKTFLKQLGVAFDYIDVDTLQEPERSEVVAELEKWNPSRSFPTIVIDNEEAIIGFQQERIKVVTGK